jgi:hypothetical protein
MARTEEDVRRSEWQGEYGHDPVIDEAMGWLHEYCRGRDWGPRDGAQWPAQGVASRLGECPGTDCLVNYHKDEQCECHGLSLQEAYDHKIRPRRGASVPPGAERTAQGKGVHIAQAYRLPC